MNRYKHPTDEVLRLDALLWDCYEILFPVPEVPSDMSARDYVEVVAIAKDELERYRKVANMIAKEVKRHESKTL